eukprot:1093154-Amphidinium_carterae.1
MVWELAHFQVCVNSKEATSRISKSAERSHVLNSSYSLDNGADRDIQVADALSRLLTRLVSYVIVEVAKPLQPGSFR